MMVIIAVAAAMLTGFMFGAEFAIRRARLALGYDMLAEGCTPAAITAHVERMTDSILDGREYDPATGRYRRSLAEGRKASPPRRSDR